MGTKHLPDYEVEVIGHRGHVSAYPENSLEGFISLVNAGADALELDLVISKDKEVVVSHEPYMAASYMLTPEGYQIEESEEKNYRLYEMTYDSIQKFQSDSRPNLNFPEQKRIPTYKPLLKEVITKVEAESNKTQQQPLNYYLELKSEPAEYGLTQPHPEEFVDLVMEVVRERKIEERVVLMSFDAQLLNTLKSQYPGVKVSHLLYQTSVEEGLSQLNFKPEILGPHFQQLKSREQVLELQKKGFKIIPWTVNKRRHINSMMDLGVDGIISDFPEKVLVAKKRRKS